MKTIVPPNNSSNTLLLIDGRSNQFAKFFNILKVARPIQGVLYAISLIILMTLSSCSNKSAEDIEKELSSGVVLIQNKSYYEVKFSNGESLFFTDYDDEEGINGLVAETDSVEMAVSYGTGFFISEDGKIATNYHVVADMTEEKDITNSISNLVEAVKQAVSETYNEIYSEYEQYREATEIALFDPDVSIEEYNEIKEYRNQLQSELESYEEFYNNLSYIKPENSEIIYHNELSIGYNDTYVTKDSDLHPCVIRNSDKDKDLAIIQLKDKKTPQGKYVFNIPENDPLEEYGILEKIEKSLNNDKNAKIYMPAFNLGPSLAITSDGLKLQLGSGTISRQTSDKIMHTIPSLPGSSGSPIVNQKGEVIAINYARVDGSDSFNFGIRIKQLRKLLSDS